MFENTNQIDQVGRRGEKAKSSTKKMEEVVRWIAVGREWIIVGWRWRSVWEEEIQKTDSRGQIY